MTQPETWSEAEEIFIYRAGQKVELKRSPGKIDVILAYDPMMVPPIVLANDPQPRYPEELDLVVQPILSWNWFKPVAKRSTATLSTVGSSKGV
jgi:hypothetical protein